MNQDVRTIVGEYSPEACFLSEAFPCNPRPFATRLADLLRELCAEKGTEESLADDRVRACLWIINAMAFGQLATIDQHDEWNRLERLVGIEGEHVLGQDKNAPLAKSVG